jgi:hypothetical protein
MRGGARYANRIADSKIQIIVVEPLELPMQEPKAEPEPSREAQPQPAEAPVAQ